MDTVTTDSILNVFYKDPTAIDRLRDHMPLIKVVLIALAGYYAPELPKFACSFFKNDVFRLLVIVTMVLVITYDINTALALGVTIFVLLHAAMRYDFDQVMAGTACGAFVTPQKEQEQHK